MAMVCPVPSPVIEPKRDALTRTPCGSASASVRPAPRNRPARLPAPTRHVWRDRRRRNQTGDWRPPQPCSGAAAGIGVLAAAGTSVVRALPAAADGLIGPSKGTAANRHRSSSGSNANLRAEAISVGCGRPAGTPMHSAAKHFPGLRFRRGRARRRMLRVSGPNTTLVRRAATRRSLRQSIKDTGVHVISFEAPNQGCNLAVREIAGLFYDRFSWQKTAGPRCHGLTCDRRCQHGSRATPCRRLLAARATG